MIGLFYPNRAAAATVSGGSWLAAAPAGKVINASLPDVARSTNALAASTKLQFDLGAARVVQAFAMAYTNLSDAATWVVKVGTTAGAGDVLTSAALPAWILTSETAMAALGVQDLAAYYTRRFHNIFVNGSAVTGRYITFEITDTGNAAGYVEVGRAFIAGGYIPTINASYGLKDNWDDLSTKERAESGSTWATKRRRKRGVSFVLEQVELNEAVILHDLQRLAGTVEDVLYVPDITDAQLTQRYGFIGNLRELSALEYPFFNRRALPLSIEEIA